MVLRIFGLLTQASTGKGECSKRLSSKTAHCLLRPAGRHPCLARGAYTEYVSTTKGRERSWRHFSTFPSEEGEAECTAKAAVGSRGFSESLPFTALRSILWLNIPNFLNLKLETRNPKPGPPLLRYS